MYKIIVVLLMISVLGCKERLSKDPKRIQFFPVEYSQFSKIDRANNLIEGEDLLVENFPNDENVLINMMFKYREQYGMEIDSLCHLYGMSFYKYTEKTKIFLIERERRDLLESKSYSLGEEREYNLGDIFIKPNPKELNKWIYRINVWREFINYGAKDARQHTIFTDSLATLLDGKIILSKPLPE